MTEINGKRYYTWDEIRAMPLGTKFTLPVWRQFTGFTKFIYLKRNEKGMIEIYTERDCVLYAAEGQLFLQDRFELVEDRPEREYVTGCQALEKLITGEWKKIVCDHEDWDTKFIYMNEISTFYDSQGFHPNGLLRGDLLKLKKWYEYKEQE